MLRAKHSHRQAQDRVLRAAALGLAVACSRVLAEGVDVSQLPRASTTPVDFQKDILPILQNHCLKCHSDEKPKSRFRLTSREAALAGGEHGIDIIPGKSSESPLIQYVARLVPDMEMPPEGRGEPLTPEQIGLLRAWIDQGAAWSGTTDEPAKTASASPIVGGTLVTGDEKKFRELYWQREGWNGGLEEFELVDKPTPDSKVTTSGHILLDDYRLTLTLQKNDLGFGHFGWYQFRKYYDDTGGYYPLFSPSSFSLNQDLHFDEGRAWAELGLTLPRWPELRLGYEHQYRDGSEATLQWGPVNSGTESRNIYPAFKDLSEKTEILKFDLDYELAGVVLSDSFRGEWYRLNSYEVNDSGFTAGGSAMALTTSREHQDYFQGANTIHLEKQFTGWLFASGGYLYSKLSSDGTLDVETQNPALLNPISPPTPGWQADPIQLERDSQVFSLSTLLGPWQGLSLSLGVQDEWTHQTGLGVASVNVAVPVAPFLFPVQPPENLFSDWDRTAFGEEVGLRFTKIPFTTLFADLRLQQDSVGLSEQETSGLTPFMRETDATGDLKDLRAGFNCSPWRRVSWSAQYRRYDNATYYDNFLKDFPGQSPEGYPGFITQRDLLSNDAQTKLALQVAPWLKTTLTYDWLANDYRTVTEPVSDPISGQPGGISPGGGILAGTYNAQITSINAALTPWRRFFLSTTFAYQHARTVTQANQSPSVAPYLGDIYSVVLSGSYLLNDKTDLIASYSFSTADFSQADLAAGLPLGIQYQQQMLLAGLRRKMTKHSALGLQYRFYLYDEPSSGGASNFQAHAVFATLHCVF